MLTVRGWFETKRRKIEQDKRYRGRENDKRKKNGRKKQKCEESTKGLFIFIFPANINLQYRVMIHSKKCMYEN